MSDITYTDGEILEFESLVEMGESPNQLDRITGRIEMMAFIKKHGREKCDEMFKAIS